MATIHTFTGNEVIATEVPKYLNDNFSALDSVDEDIKTQLGAKAPLASPTLTGTPKAPTASQGTNTTQIATTAFVAGAVKVKSVNGKTGDVVVGEIVDASISGKEITLTFADGSTKTLTTQDTAPFTGRATSIGGASATKPAVVVASYRSGNNWYRKYSDGFIIQGGIYTNPGAQGSVTITLPIAFTSTNYTVVSSHGYDSYYNTSGSILFDQVWGLTKTSFTAYCGAKGSGGTEHRLWIACGV